MQTGKRGRLLAENMVYACMGVAFARGLSQEYQ